MKPLLRHKFGGGIPNRMAIWLIGLALLAGLATPTRAVDPTQSVPYSTTVSIRPTDWTNTLLLPKFDPSYGTLQSVAWTVEATLRSFSRIENLDPVPHLGVVHGVNGAVTLYDSGGFPMVTSTLSVRFTNNFGVYDGLSDFGGSSGVSAVRRTVSTVYKAYATGSLAWYVGYGQIKVPLTATAAGFVTGLNTFLQQVRPDAGATITVTYTYTPPSVGMAIGDQVWSDDNGNGVKDPAEPGLPNVTVQLRTTAGALITQTTTDASGLYQFPGVGAGQYRITVVPPANYLPTYDLDGIASANSADFILLAGVSRYDIDFGYRLPATVGNLVSKDDNYNFQWSDDDCNFEWNDDNRNGGKGAGEAGVDGVSVGLHRCSEDRLVETATTTGYVVSAVVSGNSTGNSAVVSTIPSAGLPNPWNTRDIGSVTREGGASQASGVFTVVGAGAGILNTSDDFRYVYQVGTGDCSVVARVSGEQNTDGWAKAGVMIRETLTADSKHASVFVMSSNGVTFQSRCSTTGSSMNSDATGLSSLGWVRIVRVGDQFTASRSSTGSKWTRIGSQTIPMGSSVYIGLAVAGQNEGALCTARFGSVRAVP